MLGVREMLGGARDARGCAHQLDDECEPPGVDELRLSAWPIHGADEHAVGEQNPGGYEPHEEQHAVLEPPLVEELERHQLSAQWPVVLRLARRHLRG